MHLWLSVNVDVAISLLVHTIISSMALRNHVVALGLLMLLTRIENMAYLSVKFTQYGKLLPNVVIIQIIKIISIMVRLGLLLILVGLILLIFTMICIVLT